ncbi:13733_t:CDS:2, partial [Dentiscutata erythropus]
MKQKTSRDSRDRYFQETQRQNFHQQSQPTPPRFDFDDSRFKTLIGKMTQKQVKECLSTLERRCDILKHTLSQEQNCRSPTPTRTVSPGCDKSYDNNTILDETLNSPLDFFTENDFAALAEASALALK